MGWIHTVCSREGRRMMCRGRGRERGGTGERVSTTTTMRVSSAESCSICRKGTSRNLQMYNKSPTRNHHPFPPYCTLQVLSVASPAFPSTAVFRAAGSSSTLARRPSSTATSDSSSSDWTGGSALTTGHGQEDCPNAVSITCIAN